MIRDSGLYGKAEGKVSSVSRGSKPLGELESLPSPLLYRSGTREFESLRSTRAGCHRPVALRSTFLISLAKAAPRVWAGRKAFTQTGEGAPAGKAVSRL